MTARFGRTNCTLRKNGLENGLCVKTNRGRKPSTSNYPIVSVCKIVIGVTGCFYKQHYSAEF
jgi:G:T-mismatch repair DNA endonuclease (very short patch repair protein)